MSITSVLCQFLAKVRTIPVLASLGGIGIGPILFSKIVLNIGQTTVYKKGTIWPPTTI